MKKENLGLVEINKNTFYIKQVPYGVVLVPATEIDQLQWLKHEGEPLEIMRFGEVFDPNEPSL